MTMGNRALLRTCAAMRVFVRNMAECKVTRKGLVLGAYDSDDSSGEVRLTPTAKMFDEEVGSKLTELLKGSGLRKGKVLVFGNLGAEYSEVAVAGLGSEDSGYSQIEALDVAKENIRIAAGAGAKALHERAMATIDVEGFTNCEAAAEGASLAVWSFDDLRRTTAAVKKEPPPLLRLYSRGDYANKDFWTRGTVKAECQNLARKLENAPSNLMTPAVFAQACIECLCPCGIQVEVKGRDWLEAKRMTAFLSMARGSSESPLLIEANYVGAPPDVKPVMLVGKGVTFDTGGLNVKPCSGMDEYRADMCGAAVVAGTLRAAASLALPINIRAVLPLCENCIGGVAMKPGDVVISLSGKTIRIQNTDLEGRVVLADALAYTMKHKPCLVMNVADITTGLKQSIGEACSGVFSTSDDVWKELRSAGAETGDRFWRFPLWKYYSSEVTDYVGVDINNTGKGRGGDPCLGAAFLLEFVPPVDFVHIDISGTGLLSSGLVCPYLRKGSMSGRPTRSLTQFLYRIASPKQKMLDEPSTSQETARPPHS